MNQEQETARKAFIGVIADTIASLCMEAARHTAKEQDGSGMKLKEPGKENSGRTETGCRQVSGSRDGYNS